MFLIFRLYYGFCETPGNESQTYLFLPSKHIEAFESRILKLQLKNDWGFLVVNRVIYGLLQILHLSIGGISFIFETSNYCQC